MKFFKQKLGICGLLFFGMAACNTDIEKPIELIYISDRTVVTDPETGAERITQHHVDDQIVVRIDRTNDVIEVFNPKSGHVLYHYSSFELKVERFCDSLLIDQWYDISEDLVLLAGENPSLNNKPKRILMLLNKAESNGIDCNEITYFTLTDRLD